MKQLKNMMGIIIACLFVSSFSIFLVFAGDYQGELINKICAYAMGIAFWLGLLVGYAVFIVFNKKRKQDTDTKMKQRPGIVCFFSNRYATFFDVLLAISLIVTIVCLIVPSYEVIMITALSLCLFSFHMHSILNGINFKYLTEVQKER